MGLIYVGWRILLLQSGLLCGLLLDSSGLGFRELCFGSDLIGFDFGFGFDFGC